MVIIPDRLRLKAFQTAGRREWLATLPGICRRLSAEWSVELGTAFDDCHVSLVVSAERGPTAAVLKVPMPAGIDLGTLAATARAGEAEALRLWAGHGAVRLLEHDAATGAMLTERCVPGSSLENILDGAETDRVATSLLEQLHQPPEAAEGFVRLADRATALAKDIVVRHEQCGAPFDQWLVDLSVDLLTDLAGSEPAPVILHGDFHHHNILAASRVPWLAIDPLPMVGDPAYDAVQYLLFRKGDLVHPEKEWGPVIHQFCTGLGVDAERAMAWLFVRLVSDAVAAHAEEGESVASLEYNQADLWSARLIHRLRA